MHAVFRIAARAYDMQEARQTTGEYYCGMNKVYSGVRAHPSRRAVQNGWHAVAQVES